MDRPKNNADGYFFVGLGYHLEALLKLPENKGN